MIELPTLYPHQIDQKDRTRSALARHGWVILCAPPGVGKTRMAKWVLGSSANREPNDRQSGHSLFAVHRRGLVDNAVIEFKKEPALPHGIIMSGCDTSYGDRTQVASIDSLLRWFIDDGMYHTTLTFDLIAYDECHSNHQKLATFLKYHADKRSMLGLQPAYGIGLSGTPQAKGLADVYKEIVAGPTTQWLIDNKYLSPFRYFRGTEGRLDLLVKRGNEFTKASEYEAMDGLSGDLVRDWKQFAEGRPTVGFFPRRSHAKDAMVQLEEAGLRVAYVDGNTPDDERRLVFGWLDKHEIDYLCNVQVVERGTDIPAISCVQLCVAMASVVACRQKIGRGARFNALKYPAKKDCVVIDHGGNTKRLGLFEDDPQWTLDITTKDPGEVGVRPMIECPKCRAIYRGGLCRNCGYEPTPRERRAQGLQFDGSELKEVTRKEKKETKAKSAHDLMVDALYKAGRSGRTYRQCAGIFGTLSKKQGSNYRVPRHVTVGGHRYKMIRYGSDDSNRRVSVLYPFVTGEHGGAYLVEDTEPSGAPY